MISKIGIATPLYVTEQNDRLKYFQDTVGSVLAQDTDFLWVIVNDESPHPETEDYLASIGDKRVRVLNRQRRPGDIQTASNALNMGFDNLLQAGIEYFTYVHSDDILTQDSLELRAIMLADGNDVVYGKRASMMGDKIYAGSNLPYSECRATKEIMGIHFPHHTTMWSQNMIQAMRAVRGYELFDSKISYGEDLDVSLFSRNLIEQLGFNLSFVDNFVYIWVRSQDNITSKTNNDDAERFISLVHQKNGFNYTSPNNLIPRIRRPFFWLPESMKGPLRPLAGLANRLTMGFLYPSNKTVDINPYWFRNAEN